MKLQWLELRDFRSYDHLRFEPGDGVNVLVGDNGAGKTSLLEAIGYLASLGSFRGSPDGSLVADGADEAIVRGEFVAEDVPRSSRWRSRRRDGDVCCWTGSGLRAGPRWRRGWRSSPSCPTTSIW